MATSMIPPVIQKLGSLPMDEANYLLQAKPEVESLRKELNLMTTSSLKNADAIHHKSERAKEWARQLKELVFEAKDSIDVFVRKVAQKGRGGVVSKLPKLLINAHRLKGKIEDIKAKIKKLLEDRMNYDIKPSEEDQTSAQAHQGEASCESTIDIMLVDVGGFQSKAEELVKLLMEEKPRGQFGVVSITGIGALEITFLAYKIYNRDDVKKHFDCQACVYISKEYKIRDVLFNIIKQVMVLRDEEEKALALEEAEKLKEKLSEFLRDKKNYLFVLDDVWSEDWNKLKRFFPVPCNYQQCRVLLTTRDEGAIWPAELIAPPYKLQLLDKEGNCTELPDRLKLFFPYFGFFPKDTKIQRDRLIRLWVAEGFLEPKGDLTMEDVGGECLEELMQWNLIQVEKWKSNGVPDTFIIHDLFLNLAISMAKEDHFLKISTPHHESWKYSRRVALHDNCRKDTMAEVLSVSSSWSGSSNPLRSLLCFTKMNPTLCGQFKLLNVLDLEGAPGIESLPKEIGNLISLKYLSLCRTSLKALPPWVGNLHNLQTLNLYKTMIQSVPIEIFELDKLRHLLCFSKCWVWESDPFIVESVSRASQRLSPARIQNLRDLQTLWFHSSSWIKGGLEKLTNLRELGLSGFGAHIDHKDALYRALSKLQRLEVLYLVQLTLSGCYQIHLPSFSSHSYLYDITIIGVLPNLSNLPSKLTRLRLASSNLEEDMMETLEKLPNLKELKLDPFTYVGVEIKCTEGWFPKLENLSLRLFPSLMRWIVEDRAMPNLKTLEINSLMELRCIPHGLRHITGLQRLSLEMPQEFLDRVKKGGEDWQQISHVPFIMTREVHHIPKADIMSRNLPRDMKELSCSQPRI
ncbi:disease resistance RPP8-like protein 3 [Macadamia integrifolia]|uniref:disease resistance RPP8-like protein 3 n=1 Tax=Macadamia integrifolia TaxID=60698 RepID=UPI001C4E3E3F|nr:disease resistance RPP8-like protein 3 [Macadamia integrifolia]